MKIGGNAREQILQGNAHKTAQTVVLFLKRISHGTLVGPDIILAQVIFKVFQSQKSNVVCRLQNNISSSSGKIYNPHGVS